MTAVFLAATYGRLPTLIWLLQEVGGNVKDCDDDGKTPMLCAAAHGEFHTLAWLLEHGGSNIAEKDRKGRTAWDLLDFRITVGCSSSDGVSALLRIMVVRGAPPVQYVARMSSEHVQLVEEGARLLARLPTYLARRLKVHCPLIAPLRDLVSSYEYPTTTEELWATALDDETD
jgi:hypothetical protein